MVNRAAAPRGKAAKQGERGPGGGATYDPVRSVFVGNLDFKVWHALGLLVVPVGGAAP
jgi:hypothetical protein